MRYFWNNLIDGASVSFSASSEDSEFPVENLADQRIEKVWKTGATLTDESVVIDFGAAVAIQAFICHAHDLLDTDSTIKIQGNATLAWTSPSVDVTLTRVAGPIVKVWDNAQVYRYWRFIFTKASAGVSRSVGRLFLGPLFSASNPVDKGYKESISDPSVVTSSISGQVYSNVKTTFRNYALTFDGILDTEKDSYDLMTQGMGTHSSFFMQISASVSPFTDYVNVFFSKQMDFEYISTNGTYAYWKATSELREVV
jgi:hypothetical protein